MRSLFLALAALVLTAGCITNAPMTAQEAPTAERAPWKLEFKDGCLEGGFVAPYNTSPDDRLADVFKPADIREEINNPNLVSTGVADGPLTGNWHQGFQCRGGVLNGKPIGDLHWGYVGQWIEAPEWDDGGADIHVHLTGFGLQPGPARDALVALTKMDVTETINAEVTDHGGDVVSIYLRDVTKGIYEIHGPILKYRGVDERVIRLWWYVPTDGTQSELGHVHPEDIPNPTGEPADHHRHAMEGKDFHPVWIDIVAGAGEHYVSADAVNVASHSQEGAHGGLILYLPEVAETYDHDGVSMELGRLVTNVVLSEYHAH